MLVQKNFGRATNSLNTAIERLTTGYRINSAKDDAVGKAVSIDMDVKLSSNEVVQNNVEMGVSLLNTAEGNLNLIKDKVQRCRNLCEQALNGTYDSSSQNAIKAELNQLVAQINQIKETSEFNGITLFDSSGGGGGAGVSIEEVLPNLPQTQASGFISNVSTQNANTVIDSGTTDVSVAEANLRTALASNGTIGISSATGLQALANVVNGTNDTALDCAGKTIVLTQDIDLGGISNWTPIGNGHYNYSAESVYSFCGKFNGNGHSISNMRITSINSDDEDVAGLFGHVENGTISNTAIKNANLSLTPGSTEGYQSYQSGLFAGIFSGQISNCYSTGCISENITDDALTVGGIIGELQNDSKIINCYSTASINIDTGTGVCTAGGIVGGGEHFDSANISKCYYNGNMNIKGDGSTWITAPTKVGGVIGFANGTLSMSDCRSKGTISGTTTQEDHYTSVGGLIGTGGGSVNNSASECMLIGRSSLFAAVGGICGEAWNLNISNSYVASKIQGDCYVNNEYWVNASTAGIFAGFDLGYAFGETSSTTPLTNCKYDGTLNSGINPIGFGSYTGSPHDVSLDVTPDSTEVVDNTIKIQIGLDGSGDSSISFDLGFSIDSLNSVAVMPNQSMNLTTIDSVLSEITSVETQIGAGLNRLESVQESLQTQHKTLTAARSIVKDADVSQESARYIRSQILQQASASLLTVANQSPSLMLSLINGMTR